MHTMLTPTGEHHGVVVDDLTRRDFMSALAAAGLLVACGGQDGSASSESAAATRSISHFAGTTEVPSNPRRIVTLQDQNSLLPLLELGVKPIASAGLLSSDGTRSFRRTEGFDTAGIEWIGEYGEPNLEAIAAVRPDLIIADEFSATDVYQELSAIAPTVFVQVFDRPLTDALLQFAEVVGRRERAEELFAGYRARIDSLQDALGERLSRTSVSLLSTGDPGVFYQSDSGGQAQFTVMRDLGLPRPSPQRPGASEDFVEFSLEDLPDHDADAVIVNDFSGEGQSPGLDALQGSPLYANLAATQAGQSYVIDATRSVGSAWARMDVFIGELESILLDPAFDSDVVREEAS